MDQRNFSAVEAFGGIQERMVALWAYQENSEGVLRAPGRAKPPSIRPQIQEWISCPGDLEGVDCPNGGWCLDVVLDGRRFGNKKGKERKPSSTPYLLSPQNPDVLSLGLPGLDTNQVPNWPGLRTLLQQLPPQDIDERYCLALGEEELAELRLFCAQRRREALGQGAVRLVPPRLEECTCEKCRDWLRPGEYGVFAARAGEQRCWHRACFACQACGQALINLIYFYHNGHLYCGRHHAELLRPRCPACDQLIFSPRCTEAEGQRWHENHFCCQDCAGPLGGGRYALPGGGPCCPTCFESRYSDVGSSLASTLEGRVSLAAPPPPNRIPQTRASGPAALTARPWPERSKGLPNPPRVAVEDAAGLAPGLGTRPPSAGEARLDRVEGGDRASLHATTISGAALLVAAASSSREAQRGLHGSSPEQDCRAGDNAEAPKGPEQSPLETPLDPTEDAPCPTCSSSSDSEPEGFFLGQRLPRPCKTPGSPQAGASETSKKHCIIC
ncbi:PREDICTED: prickle-like protein 4 [Hipposideros armiger]|uniref:Prickle-like protein 4 n=1 Tax=Hipposideros armiger TaxID=186990 RepID=A0A8B7RAY0_HIPAR|nr:PREDICTED: prickle-like protein 4 [Hipposideros armiger]